jgi:hypothetical protein
VDILNKFNNYVKTSELELMLDDYVTEDELINYFANTFTVTKFRSWCGVTVIDIDVNKLSDNSVCLTIYGSGLDSVNAGTPTIMINNVAVNTLDGIATVNKFYYFGNDGGGKSTMVKIIVTPASYVWQSGDRINIKINSNLDYVEVSEVYRY